MGNVSYLAYLQKFIFIDKFQVNEKHYHLIFVITPNYESYGD